MPFPFFYKKDIDQQSTVVELDEDTSKHIVQVLRMQNGEMLQLTDGKGRLLICQITDNHRKKCVVKIGEVINRAAPENTVTIAVSLLKNTSRFEWFLEKATEIGVTEIIPLICARTEKQNFRYDRMNCILISAMLQSQQTHLPLLLPPQKIKDAVSAATQAQKFMAYCEDDKRKLSLHTQTAAPANRIILIGPEGDFTNEEIEYCLHNQFIPVSLGSTRLRTETAALVAASILCIK